MRKSRVFEASEEGEAGGTSHCWVEKRRRGCYMLGIEPGQGNEPCESSVCVVVLSNLRFGMGFVGTKTRIAADNLRATLTINVLIRSSVTAMTANGMAVDPQNIEDIMSAAARTLGKPDQQRPSNSSPVQPAFVRQRRCDTSGPRPPETRSDRRRGPSRR